MTLEKPEKVYLKCTLRGDPALIVLKLKERVVVGSVREAVVHGLLQVIDTASGRLTTIKVKKIGYSDGSSDLVIHQIEGVYETKEDFDREWNIKPDKEGFVNFMSLDLQDSRKLVNALMEEIRG